MNEKQLAKIFKAIGESSRLKILKLLSVSSMCVCELSEVLDMRQPRVSQHLKTLKEVELVTEYKEGYWTYHSLNWEKLDSSWVDLTSFLKTNLEDLSGHQEIYQRFINIPVNEQVKQLKKY